MTPAEIELLDALQELYDFSAVQYGQNRDESLAAFAKAGEVLRKYRGLDSDSNADQNGNPEEARLSADPQ